MPETPLILVVDDDETATRLATTHLKRAGFETVSAYDGESALELAFSRPPDLVLLDLMLPGIDGFEVCRRLKAEEKTKSTPILIISSHRNRDHVMKALQTGADDFIVKPIDPHILLHKIETNIHGDSNSEDPSSAKSPLVEKSGPDKRNYARLKEVAEGDLHLPIEVIDISEGGAGILASSPVQQGSVLNLRSSLLEEITGMAMIPVRVRYSVGYQGKHKYRMGTEFVGIAESERKKIRQYIFRRQARRVRVKDST